MSPGGKWWDLGWRGGAASLDSGYTLKAEPTFRYVANAAYVGGEGRNSRMSPGFLTCALGTTLMPLAEGGRGRFRKGCCLDVRTSRNS